MDSYVFFGCNGPIHSQKTPRVGPISSLAANSRRAAAVSWHGPADWAPARTSLKRWSRCGRWKMLEVGCGFRSLGCLRTCWSCRVWWLWWHGMVHWTGRVDWEESCLHMVVEEKLGQRSRITNNMTKELALSQSLRSAVADPCLVFHVFSKWYCTVSSRIGQNSKQWFGTETS